MLPSKANTFHSQAVMGRVLRSGALLQTKRVQRDVGFEGFF